MPRLSVVVASNLLVTLALAGCNVFDPKLWMNAVPPDAGPPPADAGDDATVPTDVADDVAESPDGVTAPDLAPDTAPLDVAPPPPDTMPMVLADRCEDSQTIMSGSMMMSIDTTNLKNDYSELAACAGHDLPGNDGFVTVEMAAGEKWHVHVNPLAATFDPGIYILSSCDTRACSPITAMDECGAGKSEHLSFIAPQSGLFHIGVDSVTGGGPATLLVLKPTCGNGVAEHSETCDDGNTVSGDGCDSLCRKELTAADVSETEPNDDPRAANVILGAARMGGTSVVGAVASRCDHDMFSVTVPASGTIRATLTASTLPCGAEGAPVKVTLLNADGQTPVNASIVTNSDCPTLEAKMLPAGEYFLVVRRPGGDTLFPYQMLIETPAVMP